MTNRLQEQWIAGAVGRAIDPDNAYGLQCVDVADDYAEAIFPGLSWAQTIGGVNGAREFYGRTNDYFQWVPNVVGDSSSVPVRGDLVIFNGSRLNPYGHVAVVLSADANTITVIQQDGFLQSPAAVATLPYDGPGTGPCLGWLRPRVAADPAAPPAPPTSVRTTGPAGVRERLAPTVNADQDRLFGGGLELTMQGYVWAEGPGSDPYGDGNNCWYVGISGKYFHSAGFVEGVDGGGLPDLTPKAPTAPPALSPTQRIVGASGASKRSQPDKNADLLETFAPGDVLNFTGYVRATRPYGAGSSDVWFVGTSGAYIYSGAVEGGDNTSGLQDKTPATAPSAPPAPVEQYAFTSRWKCVTRVAPASLVNFQRGNFPARPTHLVVHQMDDPDKHPTLEGTADYFHTPRPDRPTSAHMGASEGELWEFVQTLVDRAYHAGSVGNNFLSVEVPPNPSAKTIETVKRFLREFRDTMGYELILIRHKDVEGNNTRCGTNIPLELFSIAGELTPAPSPDPTPTPTPPPADGTIAEFLQWCVTQILAAWRARK